MLLEGPASGFTSPETVANDATLWPLFSEAANRSRHHGHPSEEVDLTRKRSRATFTTSSRSNPYLRGTTMSRTPDPRLNASLIREGRMIFQQLQQIFGNRQPRTTNFNDVMIAEAQAKAAKAPALKCCFCLDQGKHKDAITVAKGHAVCTQHLSQEPHGA
jgi:hypothetical protein